MRRILALFLIAAFCHSVAAQAQQTPQIGLYIDDTRSEHCAFGSDYHPVDVYAWGRPGENGMKSMLLQVKYPDNVIPAYLTYNDNVSTICGDPGNGVVVTFTDCQYDWIWAFRHTVILVSGDAGLIQAYPVQGFFSPWSDYIFGIQNCDYEQYYPFEPAERVSNVCINFCSEDIEPPLIEEVRVVDKSTLEVDFSEELSRDSAENVDNYAVYNRLTLGDSISVASATLLGGGTTVGLGLAEPFIDNTPYLLEANGVADMVGNMWVSRGQFGNGPDFVISELVFQDTLSGCVEAFNVACTVVNIGEFPAQYTTVALFYQGVDDEGNPVDSHLLDIDSFGELAAGDSVTAQFEITNFILQNFYFYSLGNITVIADPDDHVDEAREDNNVLSSMLVTLAPRVISYGLDGDLVQVEFHRALYDSGDMVEPVTRYEILRHNDTLGVYETAAMIDADCSPEYIVDFPPFPDAEYTRFFIRAVRPAGGTTYHYDNCVMVPRTGANVAPSAPTGFTGRQVGNDMYLEWDPNWEPDLRFYAVWWNDTPDFPPDPDPPDPPIGYKTTYTHLTHRGWEPGMELYYRICAVDHAMHRSEYVIITPSEVVSTQLQSFSSHVKKNMIEVSWSITASQEVPEFQVFRSESGSDRFERLDRAIEQTGDSGYRYVDSDVLPGETYLYRIEVRDDDGSRVLFETDPIAMPALSLTLYQNHPNPFNPSTTIRFYLPERCPVRLEVFDVSGRRIALLAEKNMDKGAHTVKWNGEDAVGSAAASGVYFYRLTAGKKTIAKKMILLR